MRAVSTINSGKKNAAIAIMSGLGYRNAPQLPAQARRDQLAKALEQAVISNDVAATKSALMSFKEAGGDLDRLPFHGSVLGRCYLFVSVMHLAYIHESKEVFVFLWASLNVEHRGMAERFLEFWRMRMNMVPKNEPLPSFDEELLILLTWPRDLEMAKSTVLYLSSGELVERYEIEWLRIARLAMAHYEALELAAEAKLSSSSKKSKTRL